MSRAINRNHGCDQQTVEDALVDKFSGAAIPAEWLPALSTTVTQLPALRRKHRIARLAASRTNDTSVRRRVQRGRKRLMTARTIPSDVRNTMGPYIRAQIGPSCRKQAAGPKMRKGWRRPSGRQ